MLHLRISGGFSPGRPGQHRRHALGVRGDARQVDARQLRRSVDELAAAIAAGRTAGDGGGGGAGGPGATYLVVFGGDEVLVPGEPSSALATVLRDGPAAGIHLLGWWRSPARFAAELGPDQVAGLVGLNVGAAELAAAADEPVEGWRPSPGRALFLDRQEGRRQLLLPFVRPGRGGEPL